MLRPESVPARMNGSDVEGGEPMIMILRRSEVVDILATDAGVKMVLKQARVVVVLWGITGRLGDTVILKMGEKSKCRWPS